MHKTRKVLIVGGFTFSRGEAGSNYVIGFGKALEAAGFQAEYLAHGRPDDKLREDFRHFTCHVVPRGPEYRGIKAAIVNLSAAEHGLLEWLAGIPVQQYHAVIVYPGGEFPFMGLEKLRKLCANKGWKHAVIVGEWQSFDNFNQLRLHNRIMAVLDSEMQIRVQYKRVANVVSISRFFERYYNTGLCRSVYVPPLVDTSAEKWRCRSRSNGNGRDLRLLFSGGWWRDRLDLMIKAVAQLRREGHPVVLEFLGSDPAEIKTAPGLKELLSSAPQESVHFHGRVPVEQVLPITASADFGVLFRERARWSDACFPSKLAEFQTLGVPMLCNLTSNLDEVLKDGGNALIVPKLTVESFVATVRRALALPQEAKLRMKERSLECAKREFDYRAYSGTLQGFLN